MNVVTWLDQGARGRPEAPAIWAGKRPELSYRALAGQVAGLAGGLRRTLGLAPGERIALVMRNCPEYLVTLYAAWWAGLAVVPVNLKLHPREIQYILEHSGARALFVDREAPLEPALRAIGSAPPVIEVRGREWWRLIASAPAALSPVAQDSLAWLFYTSGTTGRPKGAMLAHANLTAMVESYYASVDDVSRGGRLLHAAPLSHGSGLYNLTHLARGAAQVVPESGHFEAEEVLELLDEFTAVSMFAAPTMVKRLTEAAERTGRKAAGLQTLVYGGGPMYLADIHAATRVFGRRFAQIYGQGESPMTITSLTKAHHADTRHPRYETRLGSVGTAQWGIEIAIRDETGRDLPDGEVGEICVRGRTVMAGYWQDAEASARALRDGWLWTGDLGALDPDGFLTLKDRSKDLIISGGSNIYPREVEEALLTHPGIFEAAVVGRPDAEWGEAVVAFVVAREPPPTAEALDSHCLERIARFKRPREYRFVEALPKNHYGKVLKTELRKSLG